MKTTKSVSKTTKSNKRSSKSKDSVATVYLDHPSCLPIPNQFGGFDLKSKGLVGASCLPPRTTFELDCGFSIEVPEGYRLDITVNSKLSGKGVVLTMQTVPDGNKQRLSIIAHNCGKHIVTFSGGETIGRLWFVPLGKVALVVAND